MGPNRTAERAFALAAVAALCAFAVATVLAPAASASGASAFEAPVPAEYSFTPPARAGTATVDGREYDSMQAAVDAADPGDTVHLAGRFDERVVVTVPNVTLAGPPGGFALVDGGGTGDVLRVDGDGVTLRRVWVRDSGYDPAENDAGVWLNSTGATVVDSRVTAVTFGVWVDGVNDVRIANTTIVGRESVHPLSYRGNGIELWKTEDSLVEGNRITDVRDGIYYSWARDVLARENTMWDLRYGVHYMYSDDCELRNNLAFDNDVGYSLMVSKRLEIVNNTAVNNSGRSGHGVLVKSIDETSIRNNTLVGNHKGLYVYNSLDNEVVGNRVVGNDVGVHLTAGSVRESVHHNTFAGNGEPVRAVIGEQVAWNESRAGNYWAGAHTADVDGDGVSEVRYRPAGLVERLVVQEPAAALFAESPAFALVRLAESSVPVIESPGVVDYHPLVDPPRTNERGHAR